MALQQRKLTPEEYLAIERKAEYKSEFYDGQMFTMSGASRQHNGIASNLNGLLRAAFKGRPCRVFQSDMRVKISPTGLYTYPDVVAFCGEGRYEDGEVDTLLNPSVVFEVLSDSTEGYDRGGKFAHYRKVDTITDYVLVAQNEVRVEHFTRQPDGHWLLLSEITDTTGMLRIASLDCALPVSEIYDKVELPPGGGLRPHP